MIYLGCESGAGLGSPSQNGGATPLKTTIRSSLRHDGGHGKLPNAHIKRVLDAGRSGYDASLLEIGASRDLFHAVHRTSSDALQPSWDNHWFSVFDAASLMGFLIARRPKRYLEIGSGHSTLFARFSIRAGSLSTLVTSIDPQPRCDIDKICDTAICLPLESCDLTVFGGLEEGDILFFDGSHRAFTNSDAVAFVFDILPMLRPGIVGAFPRYILARRLSPCMER